MKIENIDVNIIYSSDYYDVTFHKLLQGNNFIDPADGSLNKFLTAQGGLEMKTNRFFTFYKSLAFSDHFEVIYFLFRYIVSATATQVNSTHLKRSRALFEDIRRQNTQGRIRLVHDDNSVLELVLKMDTFECLILYFDQGEMLNLKGDAPFFNDIIIELDKFTQATVNALDDYFSFLTSIFNLSPKVGEDVSTLTRFYYLWRDLKESNSI